MPSADTKGIGNGLHSSYLAVAMFILLPLGASGQAPAGGIGPAERIYGLSLIWREAAYNFPYFNEVPGLDWDEAYREAIPRVLAAESTLDYYRELQIFTALLEDGHSRIAFPDSIIQRRPFSSPWVALEDVGGQALVVNVATDLADSIPIGSEVLEVEGVTVDEYIRQRVLPYVYHSAAHKRRATAIEGSHTRGYGLLVGPAGTRVRITASLPSGSIVHLTLMRDRFSASRDWVRDTDGDGEALLKLEWLEKDIAYLAMNSFADGRIVQQLDSLLPQLRGAEGVVVDLRGNGGGNDVIAAAVLARFTDQSLVGTGWRARTHDAYLRALGSFGQSALERALPPEDSALVAQALSDHSGDAWRLEEPDTVRPAFEGQRISSRVVVLAGGGTASAAENLLVRLPQGDRFVIIGSPTAASTGQPLIFPLPGGGMGQVVTRAVLFPDGTPLVKTGVVPDILVQPSIEDVRLGRDPVLARAVQELTHGGTPF